MNTKKDNIAQASTILFGLNMIASALNYICQLFLARVLSVDSFGTINTIFSFLLIVGVPGTTLTMIVSKYYAGWDENKNKEKKTEFIARVLKDISILGIFVFCILVVLSPVLSKVLLIDSKIVLFYTFILGALSLYQPIYSGVFSGNKKFILVGIYSLFIPLYKIISIIGAYFYSNIDYKRLNGILFIMVIGNIITILYGHKKTKKNVGEFSVFKNNSYEWTDKKEIVYTLVVNIGLMLYMNVDLFAVRFIGAAEESGLYSAVLLFGRIIYYFATTLGTILLPMAASYNQDSSKRIGLLNKTLIFMLLFSLATLIPINMFGRTIINILYGELYLSAYTYIKYISLISVVLSIATILANYLVGIGQGKFVAKVILIINIAIIFMIMLCKSTESILGSIGVIGLVGVVYVYIVSIKKIKASDERYVK